MFLPIICVAFAGLSSALSLEHKIVPRQEMSAPIDVASTAAAMTGVATFVDFVHERNTICGPLSGASGERCIKVSRTVTDFCAGANGAWGAAAGSISPGFGPGGTCQGTIDMVCSFRAFNLARDLYSFPLPENRYPNVLIVPRAFKGLSFHVRCLLQWTILLTVYRVYATDNTQSRPMYHQAVKQIDVGSAIKSRTREAIAGMHQE